MKKFKIFKSFYKDILLAYRGLAVTQVAKKANGSDAENLVDVCDDPTPNGNTQSSETTVATEKTEVKTFQHCICHVSLHLKLLNPFLVN